MSEIDPTTIPDDALQELPIFPLPGTVLLPGTLVSLHIFEPRYRKMMEWCIEGHRLIAIAMLNESGVPDSHGRPPLYKIAGLGSLKRSARLPDGRYNIVVEGIGRVCLKNEHEPDRAFRRAKARLLADTYPEETSRSRLESTMASIRSMYQHMSAQPNNLSLELTNTLNEITDPGRLADTAAAAVLEDAVEQQQILDQQDVAERLSLVAGHLGTMLLQEDHSFADDDAESSGWGLRPGLA